MTFDYAVRECLKGEKYSLTLKPSHKASTRMLVNLLMDCWHSPVGHLHDEVISPLLSETFSILLSCESRDLTRVTPKEFTIVHSPRFFRPPPPTAVSSDTDPLGTYETKMAARTGKRLIVTILRKNRGL